KTRWFPPPSLPHYYPARLWPHLRETAQTIQQSGNHAGTNARAHRRARASTHTHTHPHILCLSLVPPLGCISCLQECSCFPKGAPRDGWMFGVPPPLPPTVFFCVSVLF